MKRFGHTVRTALISFGALTLAITLGSACSHEPDTANASGNIRVRIPFMNEGGGYSLQVIGLSGITSLYEFGGTYANFFIAPSTDGQKLQGPKPRGHFMKTDKGIYIPQDTEISQQMAVIYAHLERFSRLDTELGVGDLQTTPRDVGIMTRISNPENGELDLNNAYYNPETDAILLVPFTAEQLPLAVNGGVLAHEHFHSLFYKLVGRRLVGAENVQAHGKELRDQVKGLKGTGTSREVLKDYRLTLAERTNWFFYLGLNEGLADFWAWTYTGDPDFLQATVPHIAKNRSMKVSEAEAKKPFTRVGAWREIVLKQNEPGNKRLCDFYCLGTEYSRSLKGFTDVVEKARGITSGEARRVVAKAILQSLPALAVSLKELKDDQFFEPVDYLKFLAASLEGAKSEEIQYLNGIVSVTRGVQEVASGTVNADSESGAKSGSESGSGSEPKPGEGQFVEVTPKASGGNSANPQREGSKGRL